MKNVIVVMSSNREIEPVTKKTLQAITDLGGLVLLETGSSDVAFARCRALSWACETLREYPDRDVVLMLDDDMEVPTETAQALVDEARELRRPCSAIYATLSSKVAAVRWHERPGLWLVGLGCLAIPRALLLDLEEVSESFEVNGRFYSAFTWSGPEDGGWIAEDFRLSKNLGGVKLCPLAVGHIKKGALWPDDETLARLAASDAAPSNSTARGLSVTREPTQGDLTHE
jgi:hypothetical protein